MQIQPLRALKPVRSRLWPLFSNVYNGHMTIASSDVWMITIEILSSFLLFTVLFALKVQPRVRQTILWDRRSGPTLHEGKCDPECPLLGFGLYCLYGPLSPEDRDWLQALKDSVGTSLSAKKFSRPPKSDADTAPQGRSYWSDSLFCFHGHALRVNRSMVW